METMEELLKEFDSKEPKRGDIVKATVEVIRNNQVVLSIPGLIGYDAYMYADQYSTDPNESIKDLNVGDEVTVQICDKSRPDADNQYVLASRLPILKKKDQELLLEAYNNNADINVTVKKVVNKGLVADYAGCEVFIPESLVDISRVEDLSTFVNKEITIKIIDKKFEKGKDKYTGSRKAVLQGEVALKRKEEIEGINIGDIVKGTIVKFEPFGVLVKLNNAIGVLMYNQVSHYKEDRAEKIYAIGDSLTLKVISKEGNRIGLSLKALIPSPYDVYTQNNGVSQTVKGKIIQKLPIGLIVELSKGVTALLHKSEFSWNPNDNLDMCVKVGDEIEAKIIKLDKEKCRISLSRRLLLDNPWKNVDAKKGDIVNVTVTNATKDGVNVIACGVDAFIPVKECALEKGTKLEETFTADDKFDAMVLECNKDKWILSLSIKALREKEDREAFAKYQEENNDTSNATLGDIFKDKLEK